MEKKRSPCWKQQNSLKTTTKKYKNCGIQNTKTGGEFLVKLTKLALDE